MALKLGYLLPTRENIMQQRPSGRLLIDAAIEAEALGFDSLWVGDSLLARPRHDPLTLLGAVAAAVPRVDIGTAVLLPALRNPVLLAQQLATVDQLSEGRLVVGVGIAADTAPVRSEFRAAGVEFEGRVGCMMEGLRLCRALWQGEAVDWDGRWRVENGTLAPTPHRSGGPPIWMASGVRAGIERAAKNFDGWFPIGPDPGTFEERRKLFVETADKEDRDPSSLTTAIYLTVAVMDNAATADAAINTYLEGYYGFPAGVIRRIQACHGGTMESVLEFIRGFVQAGADHVVLRLVGDHNMIMRGILSRRDELI